MTPPSEFGGEPDPASDDDAPRRRDRLGAVVWIALFLVATVAILVIGNA